jgi:subtilase family serine protease
MRSVLGFIAAASLTAGTFSLTAQTANARIHQGIDSQSRTELPNSVSPRAAARYDVGRANSALRLTGVTFYFQPSAQQKAALDALVQAQQTPGSPSWHQWLSPQQYASLFGLSDDDLAKIQNWLQQQGLSVDRVSNSHTSISFSGTVAQVETAFQTEIHNYSVDGGTHFSNATSISIPSALAGVVQSVRNLNDFRPKSHARLRSPQSTQVNPNFTSSQGGSHYLTPKDVATIYDINTAYNQAYTGAGQSIAIVGQSEVAVSDIENFQKAAGLPVAAPTMVLVPNSGTAAFATGDETESDLDLEYSGGIARGATIYFVYVGNNANYSVWDSMSYAIDNKIAPIVSMSYGACESDLTSGEYTSLEALLEQGASQGQSVIVSSGDSGSTACFSDVTGKTITAAEEALAVNYPASSAWVTALGGTEFPAPDVASSNTQYWEASSGSDVISSALSYIPEQVWNDDSASTGAKYGAVDALSSSGGGASTLTPRPSWQKGVTGIASGNFRLVPDIALDSSPDNAGYLYCSSDSKSTGVTGGCANGFRDSSNQYLTVAGGTSFAAPIFAGMVAILNQKENSSGQGLLNSTLYTLAANSATYASAFHDITSGTNACTAGSTYCSSAGESEFAAGTGYDEATGLGSVDLYNLLTAWTSGTTTPALDSTTTTLTAATSSPASGARDVITIAVAPQSSSITTTPTGTLTIAVDGTTETSSLALSGGTATYTFSSTTAGSHVITATYSGNSVFASSTGTTTVTIGSTSSTNSGGFATATVTVTPSGGYTGTVDLSVSTTNTSLQTDGCFNIGNAEVGSTSAAGVTLTIYAGATNCSSAAIQSGKVRAFGRSTTASISPGAAPRFNEATFGVFGALLAGLIGWRFRKLRALSFVFMLALAGFALSGCGGGSIGATKGFSLSVSPSTVTVSAGSSGIPTGTYALTIHGVDSTTSTLTATTSLTVTID